ncbi:unnamed protein product [Fraxinus pennsylvanica]|uniref:Uncharacterized protein n=1 Tax=Fraxinus pennsylvanica TaxID=56036 RepID=A0AAD2E8Q5_9LAMI|nr:unnamed protein product [Fraxinus pennsylvanica]
MKFRRTTISICSGSIRGLVFARDFLKWAKSRTGFKSTDEVYSYFVDLPMKFRWPWNSRVKMSGGPLVNRLVRVGRPTQTVALFEIMEKDHGFLRNMDSLKQGLL